MANDPSVDILFKEHSVEEIENVKTNLEHEIEKRTELLKSIVKEKYRDIVETSDAIQSMKLNLKDVDNSLWSLDRSISEFYVRMRETQVESKKEVALQSNNNSQKQIKSVSTSSKHDEETVRQLLETSALLWDSFDSGDLRLRTKLLNDSRELLNKLQPKNSDRLLIDIEKSLMRAEEMMKHDLWHKIQAAPPDQIGLIAGSDQEDLYQLSLKSSIEFLVETFRSDLSDTSYRAQISRFQSYSYFNSQTNQIDLDVNDQTKTSGYVQIPKFISPELNTFLFKICKVINTIAGFNLDRSSIISSLSLTLESAMKVYESVAPLVETLKAEIRRKRALQLYFDLLYLRIVLNTSKNTDLIEKLDTELTKQANRYELMLDSIELYMISAALHSNVMRLSQSTIRLYGLLIPHLQ